MLERYGLERDRSTAQTGALIAAHWQRLAELATAKTAEGAAVIDFATRRAGV